MKALSLVRTTESVDETRKLGQALGAVLQPGDVIALIGPLGAGKTQLVKGIAKGAGVADDSEVTSPTFVLVNEYDGILHIHHLDAYRLTGEAELEALGFDEMVAGSGAVILEWADRVTGILPADHLAITLDVKGADRRELTFAAHGQRAVALLNELRENRMRR